MRITSATGAILVWVLLTPAAGLAQDVDGAFLEPFVGEMRFDGSCILWDRGECLAPIPRGGDARFTGLRVGYRSAGRWSLEAAWATDQAGEVPTVPIDQTGEPSSGPSPSFSEPLDVDLWTIGGTYSLVRRGPFDLYASGAVGRITFEENGHPSIDLRDLVTSVGGGVLLQVWKVVFLRGDVRAHTQWCSEEAVVRGGPSRQGRVCIDDSVLGHLEASVGAQLVFHLFDLAGGDE